MHGLGPFTTAPKILRAIKMVFDDIFIIKSPRLDLLAAVTRQPLDLS